MKKSILFLFMALLSMVAVAQVPREMSYSVMLLNPETGKILSEEDAQLRVEIRQGSATGVAVWGQDFNTKTDKNGMCQLSLNFSDDVDWGSGNLFMALIVNGKEMGAPKIASVPFAITAASVEGVICKKDLIGTWITTNYGRTETYIFNQDGTGLHQNSGNSTSFQWMLNNVGVLVLKSIDGYGLGADGGRIYNPYKISDTQFYMGNGEVKLMTKQN